MITIEKPSVEDAKDIQQVFYETWLATYPNKEAGITEEDVEEKFNDRFSKQSIQERIKDISDKSGNKLFLVAKDGKSIVGVCRIVKNKTFNQLVAIYVLPRHQGKGIGMMFWNNAIKFFGNKKDIIVQVATYNIQAINFYKKIGFVDTGKRFSEEKLRMPISRSYIPEMEMVIKAVKDRKLIAL
jgi:ribosomal protein S18 acetylase RimI-like enzyme